MWKTYLAERNEATLEEERQQMARTEDEQKLLDDDNAEFSKFINDSTPENQRAYIAHVEQLIAKVPNGDTRNILILRKALAMAEVRGEDPNGDRKREALLILGDFAYSTSSRPTDIYLRDFAILSIAHLSLQCCRLAEPPQGPFWRDFESRRDVYEERGYDQMLSGLLVLTDHMKRVSSARQANTDYASNAMNLYAVMLATPFREQLKEDDYAMLLSELGTLVEVFPTLETESFATTLKYTLLPEHDYVRAFDTFYAQDVAELTPELNASIDKKYDDLLAAIAARESTEEDKVGLAHIRMFTGLFYMQSLKYRYGTKVDQAKFDSVLDTTLAAINAHAATKQAITAYIKAGVYPFARSFAALGTTHRQVATFLEENRLTQ